MDNLSSEFQRAVNRKLYSCAFKFQEEDSSATSHFIVHFTKHDKGFELVKQVYYDYNNIGATLEKDNVYTFDAKKLNTTQSTTLDFGDVNVTALSKRIIEKYKGRRLTARKLFDEDHVSTMYSHTHYAKALRHLVKCGDLKSTFNDSVNHKVPVLINEHCNLEF